MNKGKQHSSNSSNKSKLEEAVDKTPEVKGHYENGLGAIESRYKGSITSSKGNSFTGSVDIDKATRKLKPEDNSWDYAIEFKSCTYFVEFHPADTSEVSKILQKLDWLKNWLKNKAPLINSLKPQNKNPYHWIFTGGNHIARTSKYWKRLSLAKLLPVKKLDIDKI